MAAEAAANITFNFAEHTGVRDSVAMPKPTTRSGLFRLEGSPTKMAEQMSNVNQPQK